MKHITAILVLLLGIQSLTKGQSKIVEDFREVCDSLATLTSEQCGVAGELKLKAVMKRKNNLDFYFNESLGDYPWSKENVRWFRSRLKELFPKEYSRYKLGEIYSRRVDLNKLAMPPLTFDGKPAENRHKVKSPSGTDLIVSKKGAMKFPKGLANRHIALWQSHGRYFDTGSECWQWQRPCLFQTCEDMFTQGFVLPYLVPMLENAGAYVLIPRERDIQTNEVIADNDKTCEIRGSAAYSETGHWTDAGTGFGDVNMVYQDTENPFAMGTARQSLCVSSSSKATASVQWTPDIPEKGEYAVYISYKTLPNSSSAARYTVRHRGGESEFVVNQRMGGGTWIYLGTFEFEKGTSGYVTLDNTTPKGYRMGVGAAVTADAVRFGGGIGNIARSRSVMPEDSTTTTAMPCISGMPRYTEAARYWLQWAGADSTIFHQNEGQNDYKDDFMSRGDWVEWISRGSRVNPSAEGGLGIPVDLALGFHSDAGVTPNDSIVGTLSIYTYKSEGKTVLPGGEDRLTSRMYADIVQSQIVHDLRTEYDTSWTRRSIWDRSYRESRTPACPAMLLELLSHQNFADMKYGLDPSFRFAVSRSVYKGMLKYLSNRYGCDYAVQPLPVDHMGVEFEKDSKVSVSWKAVEDPNEPTAKPTGYIVYKRIGDETFDDGTHVTDLSVDSGGYIRFHTDIPLGEIVSFKVIAFNDGGMSFPSETVSIGIPKDSRTDSTVLVVNNFDRVSGPAWFEDTERAGFETEKDSGVSYIRDMTYVGEMYNFRRCDNWDSNERPGFGASYSDMAGTIIAGNTFDYATVHGKAILASGMPFKSCSNERFIQDQHISEDAWAVDLVCGKQVTVPSKSGNRYSIFPKNMQQALKEFTAEGGNLIVSGAYIGTDLIDSIYPIQLDSTSCSEASRFAADILGYEFVTNQASRTGESLLTLGRLSRLEIVTEQNPDIYCVESPDGIAPASKNGRTICRYIDSGISSGVAHVGNGYKCVSFGFPIETLKSTKMINSVIRKSLEYLKK